MKPYVIAQKCEGVIAWTWKIFATLALFYLIWNWVHGQLDGRRDERRKAAELIFLRQNMSPEKFADYILIQQGVVEYGPAR